MTPEGAEQELKEAVSLSQADAKLEELRHFRAIKVKADADAGATIDVVRRIRRRRVSMLPARSLDAHKRSTGSVLVLAGSLHTLGGYAGGLLMSALKWRPTTPV